MEQQRRTDFPLGRVPDGSEIECPTATQLGYEDHEIPVQIPEWGHGEIIQFGGDEGIALDRSAEMGVVDVEDWA